MRLLINCPSGESRLLQVDDSATVLELKQTLQEYEGIPVHQQVLCFAGQHLKDHLAIGDHGLEQYILSDEVVLYLTQKLANPLLIYLTSRHNPSQQTAELVERDMAVGQVMALLESRALAGQFSAAARIHVKRQDGSTVPITIGSKQPLGQVEQRLAAQEGVTPTTFTFAQAQDGAMHLTIYPSAASSTATYPIYSRNVHPQHSILKKEVANGLQPLPALVKELCVLP